MGRRLLTDPAGVDYVLSVVDRLVFLLLDGVPEPLVEVVEVLEELLLRVREFQNLRVVFRELVQVLLEVQDLELKKNDEKGEMSVNY